MRMNEPTLTRLDLSLLGPFAVRLDGEPVTGFASDKVRALLAYLLLQCRLLRKIPSGGCIGFLAGAVEAFPKRLGYANPLLVECTPFVAKFLHFGRKVRSIQPERSRRLGALAELNAGLVLPERFPTFELF